MLSCSSRPAGAALVLTLLVAASALPAQAQVVIRERVEIGAGAVIGAPVTANSTAEPRTFTPTISGTLQLQYRGYRRDTDFLLLPPESTEAIADLTPSHRIVVSFNGETTVDPLGGRYLYRTRRVYSCLEDPFCLADPESNEFTTVFWKTEPPSTIAYDSYTDVYEDRGPTLDLGPVEAGVPFEIGVDYIEPDFTEPMTVSAFRADEAVYSMTARMRKRFAYPWGTKELELRLEVVPDTDVIEFLRPGDAGELEPTSSVHVAGWDDVFEFGNLPLPAEGSPASLSEDRFYVRVEDTERNVDPEVRDTLSVEISTVLPGGAVDDLPDRVTLLEDGVDSGVFVSAPQILTARDFPLVPLPDETISPHLLVTDDDYLSDAVLYPPGDFRNPIPEDDTRDDPTHRARTGGSVVVRYGEEEQAESPVCSPSDVLTVDLDVVVIREPFMDIGAPGRPEWADNGRYDEADTDDDGVIDLTEPFFDYSSSEGDLFTTVRAAPGGINTGTRGGIVTEAYVAEEVERAALSWDQACVRVMWDGRVDDLEVSSELARTPMNSIGVYRFVGGLEDLMLDGESASELLRLAREVDFSARSERVVAYYTFPGTIVSTQNLDTGTVPRPGLAGVALSPELVGTDEYPYSAEAVSFLGDNVVMALSPTAPHSVRTLAHELGHVLSRSPDLSGPLEEPWNFFPVTYNTRTARRPPTSDAAVDQRRRIPAFYIERARESRYAK